MNDLEELKIKNSEIYSLGKKTYDLKDIDGRFLGITKFSKNTINILKKNFFTKILRQNKNIDFTNAEKLARDKAIGIWALPKSQQIAPWIWRRKN